MTKQLDLFPEPPPVIPQCPKCKYRAGDTNDRRAIFHTEVYCPNELPIEDFTVDELLEFFEVVGCDDGEIMCPRCAAQFRWPPTESQR